MDTREKYFIQNFPMFIDPVSQSLEVQVALHRIRSNGQIEQLTEKKWTQLHRVQVRHDTFPFSLNNDMVHFFGMAPRAEDCPFLMVYDAVGVFRYRIDKDDGEFVPYLVPEEINGRFVVRPSVRVTFDCQEDAQQYLALVEILRDGGDLRPEGFEFLRQIIQRSVEARFTSVARKP